MCAATESLRILLLNMIKASLILVIGVLSIFVKRTHSAACSAATFPLTLGGLTGSTSIEQMDYHAGTDALVVGGSTSDTGVWGSNPNGVLPSMLSLYKGPSMAQQWALTTSMVNHISLVAFSTDG